MKKALLLFIFMCFTSQAFGKTDSLLQVAKSMKVTDTTLASVYTQLAWSYLAANDTANTLLWLRKSKTLSEQQMFDKGIMNANSNLGMYYVKFGVFDSAFFYFSQCLKKAVGINDINVASKTCINIASAYLSQGNYAESIQYYLQAMQYLDKINDQEKIAINYHCLGIAYYMLRNYPLSLKYYYLSMKVGVQTGKPDETGYNYNGIGVVYKELRQFDSALKYLERAHTAAEKNKDPYLFAHNLSDMGEVYNLQGHTTEAISCFSRALGMQAENKDQRGFAETSVLLGSAYLNNKDYPNARKYFDSARSVGGATGARDVVKNAWKGLADVYKGLNNYPASLDAYRHYADMKDTLYTEESSRQIAEMQTKYNTEKNEKENLALQKENAVKNLQITREKNQKYILAVSFAFIIIISGVYYNRFRLKQRNEMLKERELRAYAVFQAQEHEKARLSKELHDGVGALLSLIKLNISSIATDQSNEKILASTKDLATSAIKEVRGISHDLMPSVLAKSGLQAALAEMVASVSASGTLDISLSYTVPVKLAADVESNLFRIVQEATNNIVKHAAATNETIVITVDNSMLMARISDNGVGFDKSILSKITGNGLNNIYSRVNAMKGEADIITSKENGTQINIYVPLNNIANG